MTASPGGGPRRARSTTVFAGLLLVASVLLTLTLTTGFRREEDLRQEIVHAYDTRSATQALFSLVQDAETGQRGFLLTQDPSFLAPYNAAAAKIGPLRAALSVAVSKDPKSKADFAKLQSAIDDTLSELASTLDVNNRQGVSAARALVAQGRGAKNMAMIRQYIERLSTDEQVTLVVQRRVSAQLRAQRNAFILGVMIIVVTVMAVVLWRDERQSAARTRLLSEVREGAERQNAIFGSAMDTILTLNPSGSIESINAAGLSLFGYEAHELLRRDASVLVDVAPERRATFLERISSPGELERGVVREFIAKHKSGAEIPVDVALRGMKLKDGVHVVAVVRDISERRRVEVMKDHFIATVSHELRTPLTSIAGSLGLLKGGAGGQLPQRALRLVEIAESNSARLVRLINDILDVEKIRSGSSPLQKRPLQLRVLAKAARDAMTPLAFDREVALILEPIDPELWILADPDRMMQVMTNLLSNAVKVSPAHSEVRISALARGLLGRVGISDHGPGVPEEFRHKIFDRFVQVDGTDGRHIEGTGLGLPIVREIVERHGGQVDFENHAKAGATFFFDLLLIPQPTDVLPTDLIDSVKILICEDDELIAEVLRDQLEVFGYSTEIVATANAARHALHTGEFALMLLDIRLPDSDGVTLMKALRSAPATASLPIIAMSGSVEHEQEARRLGLVAWLSKPIRMQDLQNAVELGLRPRDVKPALILHVDDDPDLVEVARSRLGRLGEVVSAGSLSMARDALARRRPDLVVLDVGLPDGPGEAFLEDLRNMTPAIPTIIYTAQDFVAPSHWTVEAVLVKSRSDLRKLASIAKRILEESTQSRA